MIDSLSYIVAFASVITVIVFFHELGHYSVARMNGVRVQVFSVGIGPELVGWSDRHGTRWRISLLPLGGYVSMLGQSDLPGAEPDAVDTAEEDRSFAERTVYQRSAIVAAGPIANFILAAVLFACVYATVGQPTVSTEISDVVEGGVAESAGLVAGDIIVEVDGNTVRSFEDLALYVSLRPEVPIDLLVKRDGEEFVTRVVPDIALIEDSYGAMREVGRIGVVSGAITSTRLGPFAALAAGVAETWNWIGRIFEILEMIIAGSVSSKELAGPLGIAHVSGKMAQASFINLVIFAAILSVNLGLVNLFPVPLLDGGHLLFYIAEIVTGRPVSAAVQQKGTQIGIVLVGALFIYVTFNDLMRLGVMNLFGGSLS